MAKKLTKAEKRIAAAPASSFRRMTPAELVKAGKSAKSERYVEIGRKITARTLSISKRQFTIRKFGAGPEKLTAARREGERPYKSAATRAAAEKAAATRAKKPLSARATAAAERRFNRAAGSYSGEVRDRRGQRYSISEVRRAELMGLYQRKLAGEWIEDGDWHQLMDLAEELQDAQLPRLRVSQ